MLVDVGVGLLYKNQSGNLFGPENPVYTAGDVKIYNLIAGKEVLFYQSNLDHPAGFDVSRVDSLKANILNVMVNHQLEGAHNTTTTIVKISDNIVDTLKCEIAKPNAASSIVTKIWLSGKLKWDAANPKNASDNFGHQRAITVFK